MCRPLPDGAFTREEATGTGGWRTWEEQCNLRRSEVIYGGATGGGSLSPRHPVRSKANMFTCSSCSWIVFYFLLSLLEIAATTWLVDVDTACFFHSHCLVGLDVSTFPSVQRGVRSDELYLLDIRNEASFSRILPTSGCSRASRVWPLFFLDFSCRTSRGIQIYTMDIHGLLCTSAMSVDSIDSRSIPNGCPSQ